MNIRNFDWYDPIFTNLVFIIIVFQTSIDLVSEFKAYFSICLPHWTFDRVQQAFSFLLVVHNQSIHYLAVINSNGMRYHLEWPTSSPYLIPPDFFQMMEVYQFDGYFLIYYLVYRVSVQLFIIHILETCDRFTDIKTLHLNSVNQKSVLPYSKVKLI